MKKEKLVTSWEKRGKEKGREEGKKEIAKQMLEKGYKINEIIEITGLTKEEVSEQES
ncbi:hypothetical protein [Natranaerofaba carboxydovora]|uniref:hypothetical protein n=1 Tax=Natranaerofaba carboxydovora TaxID=2742683 RepID=UPI001F13391A|nr:hypothetical protein [Natranaerofaba carboxydovora]UMZ74731.1 hypothetical protein ACONDI_02331 [Natranaerofaba carboxydovora]